MSMLAFRLPALATRRGGRCLVGVDFVTQNQRFSDQVYETVAGWQRTFCAASRRESTRFQDYGAG